MLPTAHATSFSVTSHADSGPRSLRAAIISAKPNPNTPHTITFIAPFTVGGTVSLQSTLPTIVAQNVTITGGVRWPMISGQGTHQILRVGETNTELSISNLEFNRGRAAQKGGCIAEVSNIPPSTGTLRLTNVVFSQCSASTGSLARGGAIYWTRSAGNLIIEKNRFSANSVMANDTTGQSQSAGCAVYTNTNVSITSSLFENNESNTASNEAGGSGSGSGGA